MRERRREAAIPLVLSAGAFALAFLQRPGWATADTKINLHVDPGRLLADVASMWTSSGQLGDVQAGQQAGYLFPMGPFFALGHALGIPDWVVQRLWLGALLALAAWGVVRLLDALLGRPRGPAALVAGAVFVLNPFVVTYANRTTVTLLAYAALPWLLLAVHRGLRRPRGWGWPAAAALLIAASGGGINGAVTAWMLLGPLLLIVYEATFDAIGWRAAGGFLLRAALLTALTSLWWVVPAWVQSAYGVDFLHFTEQPGTVWGTTSVTESLRLMSFWLSYVGIGFAGRAIPYFDDARTLLFSLPVVIATLLLPAAALTGFIWTRRWRYGPFFLGLAIVALLIMGAGFPEGTPLRHGLNFTYNHVAAVRFLRASYKAAPLLAVALACLAGVAAQVAWARWRRAGVAAAAVAGVAGVAILVLAAWPLVTGRAQDAQVSYRSIPAAWTRAAADLNRELPANSRAIVLPGDLFSFYTWGGTVDPILPALTTRPVAERTEVPYADLRATDLLWTIDALVHQQRLLPGQLSPLLALISARAVITPSDDDLARSDAPPPADIARELAPQLGAAARRYRPVRVFAPTTLGPRVALAEVRRYDRPTARGLVRVERAAQPVLIDGSAAGIASLAAFGGLPADAALRFGADLTSSQARAAARSGGEVVITDSNRRRAFVSSSLEQNTGPTLPADETVSADGIILDPFGRGADAETVAEYGGIRSVQAPASPQRPQFPEHAPYAAIDGSPATAWLADPTLGPGRRWLEVDFTAPRAVPYVDLLPYGDSGGVVREVTIAGHRFAVHPGWNRLALGLRGAASLRVDLTDVSPPAAGVPAGAGGIRELRIPGVSATESLRLPVDLTDDLRGQDLSAVALSYLFERTTGDDPYARDRAHGPWSAGNTADAGDAEQTLHRVFDLPASRSFAASAWVSVSPDVSDATLDRLAGYHGAVRATSSSRFDSEPGLRASAALDGDPRTAWIADYNPGSPMWLAWRAPTPSVISRLRLLAPDEPVRRPTRVSLSWPGGTSGALSVGADGTVALPHPVRTAAMRIDVLSADAPAGATAAQRRAVGVAEVIGAGAAVRIAHPRGERLPSQCGVITVDAGAATLALRVTASQGAFDAGEPLRAVSCGAPTPLAAGTVALATRPGPLLADELELRSAAPAPRAVAALPAGAVLNPGHPGRGSVSGVRVAVTQPAWLVLGEGYNRGWQASCDGHGLGAPVPIDGYANGWRVSPGCHAASFTFAPNRLAAAGYLVSALAGLACAVLVALLWYRGRRRTDATEPGDAWLPEAGPAPVAWRPERALAVALLVGGLFGFVFGVAAGVVSVPVTTVILWRGIGPRPLTLVAGGLLAIVVPLLYILHPGPQSGGNHYGYATAHMGAHWVGVAAVGLLSAALWRALAGVRHARDRLPGPADSRRARARAE